MTEILPATTTRARIFKSLHQLIGNTPMVEIFYRYKGQEQSVYAKCEYFNLTGSIKDRMALHILEQAYIAGQIFPGDVIVEATSGNTGIAFAAVGRALGHTVRIVIPDWLSRERVDIIRSLGADVVMISKEQGGFIGSIKLSEAMAADDPRVFLPKQFANTGNIDAHTHSTGREIWTQLSHEGLVPDAFVAGIGTGGTVMGVGRFLRMKNPAITIHGLEPAESPTMSTGHKVGSHRIQGISDEFIPPIVNVCNLNSIVQVNDGDAILVAQQIASSLGLGVGISSGANLIAAIRLKQELGHDAVVVTVFCDSNKKYLSTDLVRKEPVKPGYIAPEIDLLAYCAVGSHRGSIL
jgi:cysteine synthase